MKRNAERKQAGSMKILREIPLSRPDITNADRELVLETLRTPYLSLGPRLKQFEGKFSAYLGVKHAIAVNSGTSALHLCVKALGLQDEDLAITTPFSFVASANCLLFERARPVFVDIDPDTLNVDVEKLEEKVRLLRGKGRRKSTALKAILPVHVFGRPCDMTAIMDIAKRYDLRVLEDSCEALGTKLRISRGAWKKAGTFGDCAAFGFYPNKQMTTGEGGIIATNDDAIAANCRSLRNQGRSETATWLQHERLGFNYRLSDINCALGIGQLARLEDMIAKRARVAGWYGERLKGIEDIEVPEPRDGERISWFVYVVRIGRRFSRADRDRILAGLRAKGIACGNYFTPIHLQPFYRKSYEFRRGDFPVTERTSERTIALPFFNRLGQAQVDRVCDELRRLLGV
jgi:perosamine synthetase